MYGVQIMNNIISFQGLRLSSSSLTIRQKNNCNNNQSSKNNRNISSVQLIDKNYNKLLINKNLTFGSKVPVFDKSNIDALFNKFKDLKLETTDVAKYDFSFYPERAGIIAGTLETHPYFESSNKTELPTTKEEIIALYKKNVPEKYQKYIKLGIFDNNPLATVDGKLAGRYAPQDEHTERNMRIALNRKMIDPSKHVVIADLGGPHSIAAARELANSGYVIIPHFNHRKLRYADQDTGALAYFAKEISEISAKKMEENSNAPWALIIDAHQNDLSLNEIRKDVELDRILKDKDIPPVPEGYNIIRLTEGPYPVSVSTFSEIVDLFKNSETKVFDLGLDPYKRGTLY